MDEMYDRSIKEAACSDDPARAALLAVEAELLEQAASCRARYNIHRESMQKAEAQGRQIMAKVRATQEALAALGGDENELREAG